jgi:soluble lytic murein transglycosylase-like protein
MAQVERVADLVPPEFRVMVVEAAERHGLDPRLLAAVAKIETGGTWRPDLVGSAGERGLMQVMPDTAEWIAQARQHVSAPDQFNPANSLDYGAWYISALLQDTGGDVTEALRRYNAGPAWRERAPTMARSYSRRVEEAAGEAVQSEARADGPVQAVRGQ